MDFVYLGVSQMGVCGSSGATCGALGIFILAPETMLLYRFYYVFAKLLICNR